MKKKENKTYKIKDFMLNVIYSNDLKKTIDFYQKYFGFEIEEDFGRLSVFGRAGNVKLWIIGGFKYSSNQSDTSHTSIVYYVEDLFGLFKQFKLDGIETIQKEPVKMANDMYWFQAIDPSGNIIDLAGTMELGKFDI